MNNLELHSEEVPFRNHETLNGEGSSFKKPSCETFRSETLPSDPLIPGIEGSKADLCNYLDARKEQSEREFQSHSAAMRALLPHASRELRSGEASPIGESAVARFQEHCLDCLKHSDTLTTLERMKNIVLSL